MFRLTIRSIETIKLLYWAISPRSFLCMDKKQRYFLWTVKLKQWHLLKVCVHSDYGLSSLSPNRLKVSNILVFGKLAKLL